MMAPVLLDDDGFRVRGYGRRHRQSEAEGSKGGKCQQDLTHCEFLLWREVARQRASHRNCSRICSEPPFMEQKLRVCGTSERRTLFPLPLWERVPERSDSEAKAGE